MKRSIGLLALLFPVAIFAAPPLVPPPDLGPLVARLVDAAASDSTSQANAFRVLMGLGRPAVPYIVSHLGDPRPLAERSIWVQARTGRSDTQYHPWYVHDGLLTVLKEVTGYSRAPLNGHLLPSQRARSVRKWVAYCVERYPAQAAVCQKALQNGAVADEGPAVASRR